MSLHCPPITYPGATSAVQFHYDYRGRRDSVTDQNGKVTHYAYNDADRLISVTDSQTPTPGVTQYVYDTENNLTDIYDAKQNHTHFTYISGHQLQKTTFPSGLYETYQLDELDNLIAKTDRLAKTISYTYDYQNRLVKKQYPSGTPVNYTYDSAGRLTQVTDGTGTYTLGYDNMGRLTSTTTNYSFTTFGNETVQYVYDAASNRTRMIDPQHLETFYTYDALNRLSNLSGVGGTNFGFSYDDLSRRTQLTRTNGVTTNYNYDSMSRLLSVLHQVGSTTLDGASYTYDAAGNRLTKTNYLNGITENYSYDNIYQLLQVTQGATTTESYTYDLVGNRLSSLGVSPYSYNASNQLTSLPGVTYTYDNNGNTKTKVDATGTTTYTWDFENRLTQVALPGTGGTVNFKYDPFGRRIQKSGPLGTTNYLYDGDNLIEEVDTSGNVLARYTGTRSLDEQLAELRSGATSYYEVDGLGSVTSLSSSAGAIAGTYIYDSFGKLNASSGTITNPFRFTEREVDSETSILYYRNRYYDQGVGRFLSEDQLRLNGVLTNVYAYVLNNPIRFVDPFGLSAQDVQNIQNQARNDIEAMTANGQRIDPGWLNNLTASLQYLNPFRKKPPLLGCGQQADRIAADLQIRRYDDHWDFRVEQDGPFHQRGRAISSNPSDPDIIFDPFNNVIYTVPKGGK